MESDMLTYRSAEAALLLHSKCQKYVECDVIPTEFADGDFLKLLLSSRTEIIFSRLSPFETNLEDCLKRAITLWLNEDSSPDRQLYLLSVGAAALLAFFQDNWTGPPLNSSVPWLKLPSYPLEELQSQVISSLVLDGESIFSSVRHPELLLLARTVLHSDLHHLKSALWWRFRCLCLHQKVLEERSPQLHLELLNIKEQLQSCEELMKDPQLYTLYNLEVTQMHHMYHEIQPSKEALNTAIKNSEMSIGLIGALGKRTRFQEKEISQLTLQVQAESEPALLHQGSTSEMPKDIALNDDVRLNKIAYSDANDVHTIAIGPLQLACVLSTFVQTQRSQPKDKLADEELLAYISFLLAHPQVWSIQLSSLLFRSKIESNHSRTVERSMMQMEELLGALNNESPGPWSRLFLAFCAHLSPRWHIEEELANLLVALGCINSALDIFLRLQSWESVIACYNQLQLRHKAAEIIRQELDKKETVKLWCLLGDATDDVTCYEKAWALSKERSARAQRHWGLYFFHRKQFEDAIPHLQLSLNCNSLQVTLWFQLGYAALYQEDWPTAANAYRRYCFLDPENFEAWNNLAKAYVKQGQKNRAWKALQEALKWNFENWRLWDNFMVVSLDCAVMDEVIRAYHRILDLKEKHVDTEVLDILVKAILKNLPDCDGLLCGRLSEPALELFGRITSRVTSDFRVWHLYSLLTANASPTTPETQLRAVQHMQKAHRCAVSDASWSRNTDLCPKVLQLCLELAKVSLEFARTNPLSSQSPSVLSSAKLALRAVLAKLKQDRLNLLTGEIEDILLPQYHDVSHALEDVIEASKVIPK